MGDPLGSLVQGSLKWIILCVIGMRCYMVVGSRLLTWIKAARLEDPECTKIKQLLRHKGFALRMMGCLPISNECMSEDEGLRNEIFSKPHHSPNTIHLGSTKMYKDEERSRLEFSTYLSSSSLHATFGMPPYEALYGHKCQSPL
jgi:hypothetical protein